MEELLNTLFFYMTNKVANTFLSFLLLLVAMGTHTQKNPIFRGGTGTDADPYEIKTEDDWRQISNHLDACYKLMNDITVYSSPL